MRYWLLRWQVLACVTVISHSSTIYTVNPPVVKRASQSLSLNRLTDHLSSARHRAPYNVYNPELLALISPLSTFLPLSSHSPVIQHLPHTPHLLHFQS